MKYLTILLVLLSGCITIQRPCHCNCPTLIEAGGLAPFPFMPTQRDTVNTIRLNDFFKVDSAHIYYGTVDTSYIVVDTIKIK